MSATTPQPAARREPPRFTGVTIHRDFRGRFAIRYPSDWHAFPVRSDEPVAGEVPQWAQAAPPKRGRRGKRGKHGRPPRPAERPIAGREGIGFAPNAQDPHTAFTIWAAPLPESVVAEDVDELRAGVDEALQALDGCAVEAAEETTLGNLIRFERVYTFRERQQPGDPNEPNDPNDPGVVRKRKQWLLYVDKWLMCLTWQGASVEEYAHWFAMANQSFLTFEIPEALWFAADRELQATLNESSTDPATRSALGASRGTERE